MRSRNTMAVFMRLRSSGKLVPLCWYTEIFQATTFIEHKITVKTTGYCIHFRKTNMESALPNPRLGFERIRKLKIFYFEEIQVLWSGVITIKDSMVTQKMDPDSFVNHGLRSGGTFFYSLLRICFLWSESVLAGTLTKSPTRPIPVPPGWGGRYAPKTRMQ